MYNIIDAHCHIYPDGLAPKAIQAIDRFYDGLPGETLDGTVDTLLASGRRSGISRFVVHSVATSPRQVDAINGFIAEAMRDSGGALIGLGTLHPDCENLSRSFHTLRALGLKGVKLHPDIQRFNVDSPRAMEIFALCEDAGLPVCVHTGDHRYDYSNPPRVARVLRAFPKLKFIGAHFGGWSVWDEAARTLSDYPNIVVDSSSSFFWLGPEKARELVRAWGTDRVLFATDYPMWSPQPEIDALLSMNLTDEDYERIFWRNTATLFKV